MFILGFTFATRSPCIEEIRLPMMSQLRCPGIQLCYDWRGWSSWTCLRWPPSRLVWPSYSWIGKTPEMSRKTTASWPLLYCYCQMGCHFLSLPANGGNALKLQPVPEQPATSHFQALEASPAVFSCVLLIDTSRNSSPQKFQESLRPSLLEDRHYVSCGQYSWLITINRG
jgi:hypothetical protein